MKSGVELAFAAIIVVASSSCAMAEEQPRAALPADALSGPQADYPVTVGDPYDVEGVRQVPVDVLNYDQVGYAGIIPASLEGQPTTRGERYIASSVAGAHKTLPLPTYVEVTSLDTGRTILVRLIERGPMTNARLIDLSPGARLQLGQPGEGSVAVRVRRVNPPEAERALLRGGGQAPARMDTPQSLLAVLKRKLSAPSEAPATAALPVRTAQPAPQPAPQPAVRSAPAAPAATRPAPNAAAPISTLPSEAAPPVQSGRFIVEQAGRPSRAPSAVSQPVPVTTPARPAATAPATPAAEGYVVQVAAFSNRARADALARQLDATVSGAGNVWRVRYGPYSTVAQADAQLSRVRARGYRSARVLSAR